MHKTIQISIVVPVKNGIDTLERFIKGVQLQTLFNKTEVVIVDSGSNDGSVTYLKQFNFVKVIEIDPKTFNHGATRNLAVQHCQGDFVLMTVQDAWTTDEHLLERMLAHFNDPEVAGVCGQQVVPHDADKNPHEWFRPQSAPTIKRVKFKKGEFEKLSPKVQRSNCGWDDVIAMYRKAVIIKLPFEPLVFGEDMLWAKMALEKGHTLIYDTSARVNHYHYQFPDFTRKRVLISKLFIYKCFNFEDERTYQLKDCILVVYRNIKWQCSPKWIWHNFKIIYHHRKATQYFLNTIKTNTLATLEQQLSINVPKGQQKKSRHASS